MRVRLSLIASYSASTVCRATVFGRAFGLIPARFASPPASCGEIRLKSRDRNWVTVLCRVDWSIFISTPSSTPCGCGLISCGAVGFSCTVRTHDSVSPFGFR